MSNQEDSEMEAENGNGHPIRKILRSLPKVKASPDFESRLLERLNPDTTRARFPAILFHLRRIPAFAYSFVALIAVGLISYYIFFRTGQVPPELRQDDSPNREENQTKAQEMRKPTGSESGKQERAIPEKAKEKTPVRSNESPGPASERESKVGENRIGSSEPIQSPAPVRGTETLQQTQSYQKGEQQVPVQLKSAGSKKDASRLFQPSPQVMNSAAAPQIQENFAVDLDSLARVDTLQWDSLQRAQYRLQLRQQRLKQKKPSE